MFGDQHDRIHDGATLESVTPTRPESPQWALPLAGLMISGSVAGAILGAANAVLFHYIAGAFDSWQVAGAWGAALGLPGGILIVLLRHGIWGPDKGVNIATVLGLLYGIAPGLAVLVQSAVVGNAAAVKVLIGMAMVGSMVGLIIGGVLDRITESIVSTSQSVRRDA